MDKEITPKDSCFNNEAGNSNIPRRKVKIDKEMAKKLKESVDINKTLTKIGESFKKVSKAILKGPEDQGSFNRPVCGKCGCVWRMGEFGFSPECDCIVLSSISQEKQTCGNCKWSIPCRHDPELVCCKRYPPKLLNENGNCCFPDVYDDEWCGEWQPK